MNKYRKFAFLVVGIEILIFLLCNGIYIVQKQSDTGRIYRVEGKRAAEELQDKTIEDMDLSKYPAIVSISEFHPEEKCNYDYMVEEVDGTLYRIAYRTAEKDYGLLCMNMAMVLLFVLTIFAMLFVWEKILKPFYNISELSFELAKGNLSVPIKEEKSKFFGRFLWGMDMLRENLEQNKQKELEFQKEKKTLILSLSHDIKTPLSAIELYSKALQENLYDTREKRQEALQGITKNAKEIGQYVNEIVAASREDFLHLEVNSGEFYLLEVIHSIQRYYKEKLAVIHTNFQVEEMQDCLLKGDRDRVVEVLQNVIENAIKYGDGILIRMFAEDEEDCKLIYVENTGSHVKEEELPHLFDSFYRGSNSKGSQGSGLGLYICKNLMRKMDGEIFAQKKDDRFQMVVVIRKA